MRECKKKFKIQNSPKESLQLPTGQAKLKIKPPKSLIFNLQSSINGFTLIELLLVTVILSIVGLAVYSAFSSGVRVWRRIVKNIPQEDISIFFERISRDLRNSFQYAGVEFYGAKEKIGFPTLVISQKPEVPKHEFGYVTYSLDSSHDSINRTQADYSQLYRDVVPQARTLVDNIEHLTFQYYSYDSDEEKYYWKSVWEEKENLPVAVKIELGFYDGENKTDYSRTVYIPSCQIFAASEKE